MKYCEQCGTQLEDNAEFCTECGTRCNDVSDKIEETKIKRTYQNKKKWIISAIILIGLIVGGCVIFKIGVRIKEQNKESKINNYNLPINENPDNDLVVTDTRDYSEVLGTWKQSSLCYPGVAPIEVTGGVEIIINEIKDEKITFSIMEYSPNSESDMKQEEFKNIETTSEFESTTAEFVFLDGRKGTLIIDDLSGDDNTVTLQINSDKGTGMRGTDFYIKISSETSMQEQKDVVENKKSEEQKVKSQENQPTQNMILETFANLSFYEDTWGNFGAHVNPYQGMVESAINNAISLSNYFGGDVDGLYMKLDLRVMNDDVLENGLTAQNQLYTIYFEGPSVTGTGGARCLECTVSSPDGVNFVYNETYYGSVQY